MAFDTRQSSALAPDKKQHFRRLFVDQATGSFLTLSLGMGLVAAGLPIVLLIIGGQDNSISHYYWHQHTLWSEQSDAPRNIFVGALWATGVFLFLFRGLSWQENWCLNVAGFFAIMVAMNPMSGEVDPKCSDHFQLTLHGTCASIFFLCLTAVAVLFSKKRIKSIEVDRTRRRFKAAYNLAGTLMIAMPAIVVVIHKFGHKDCHTPTVFWCETLGIWSFGFYWFVKTMEYRLLLGVRVHRPGETAATVTISD